MTREAIWIIIQTERDLQDQKWGQQNHHPLKWLAILGEEVGELCRAVLEGNKPQALSECVQVAAVCVAWLEKWSER